MSKRVLIIDNGGLDCSSLPSALGSDYNLIITDGADAGLNQLKRGYKSLSAIVLDLTAESKDGLNLLNEIRDNALWHQIPIIAASDIRAESAQTKAYSYGANAYIFVPINTALLKHILSGIVKLCELSAITNSLRKDKLTGLYNREAFFQEAEKMISRHPPGYYILSCFDVDSFKVINDQHGSEMGDNVLRHVASAINECVSSIGGICCRFMADMFAVLYPVRYMNSEVITNNHKDTATPKCLNRPIRIRIGRYLVTDTALPVSSMYDRATLAAEAIKGRYDVYISLYNEAMRDNLLHEQRIVNEMYNALSAGRFEAWLQPQYNHTNGNVIGSEALVRWRDSSGKLIPPGEFIPAFERNGFIFEVDKYVWRQVCILLHRWRSEGQQMLPVSVNISRKDVFQDDFFPYITGLLSEYDIPIDLLRLEITESAFSESPDTVVKAVNKLIDYGFTVEIDDFGSGYSSLNTLKDVPASILKLDMRFFENTNNTNRSGSIIESVIRMAKWLGMSVIAEGVEEREQADYLKSVGCNLIQGYYYAKPMSVTAYEGLLEKCSGDATLEKLETIENLDSNSFWNPKSLETLIFNSYVGGACIFEHHKGKSEIIRTNAEYDSIFSGYFECNHFLKNDGLFEFLDDEGNKKLTTAIMSAVTLRREASCELHLSDGKGHSMYIRSTVRVIAQTGDRYMIYCVIANISEENVNSIKLQEILNAIPGGVVIYRVGEKIETLYSSDGVHKLSGIDIAEYERLQQTDIIEAFVYEDDIPKLRQHIAAQVNCGAQVNTTFRVKQVNGGTVWVMLSASMINENEEGKVYYGVFTTPPTETSLYKDIVEESSNAVLVFEKKSKKILYANQAWRKLENIPDNEVISGTSLSDFKIEHELFMANEKTLQLQNDSFLNYHRVTKSGKVVDIKAQTLSWNGIEAYIYYITECA